MTGAVYDLAKRPAGTKAPRRLVALGVVIYCLVAWAALFELIGFGVSLFEAPRAAYAASSAPAGPD
jgi:hypothetical protein